MINIEEYRLILNDHTSTDVQIKKKLDYLEAFCRNIIRNEIENYVKEIKKQKKCSISEPRTA